MAYDTFYGQDEQYGETAVYNPDEYLPYEEEGWEYADDPFPFYDEFVGQTVGRKAAVQPQLLIIPAVLLTMVLLIFLSRGVTGRGERAIVEGETAVSQDSTLATGGASGGVISPYDEYVLTQGPHGYSYGHMAIDIAAGVGATIKSPISGVITERYTDAYNNPTLVIENEWYAVTFLHGNYTAVIGQQVTQGEPIGTEGNQGYTMDSAGNLCNGRAGCGYHSHLNIFDKKLNQNVNPLDLINN